jgi:putative aminopeptidase FrvX
LVKIPSCLGHEKLVLNGMQREVEEVGTDVEVDNCGALKCQVHCGLDRRVLEWYIDEVVIEVPGEIDVDTRFLVGLEDVMEWLDVDSYCWGIGEST